MKPLVYSCLLLFTFISCQVKNDSQNLPEKEKEKVEETLQRFFTSISNYDYDNIREVTSDDFVLIENGPIWDTEEFISFIQRLENDFTLSYKFSEMQTTVEGPTAWMVYKNSGVMEGGDQPRNFDWTESAVFKKEDKKWKIKLLHSTMNESDSTQN